MAVMPSMTCHLQYPPSIFSFPFQFFLFFLFNCDCLPFLASDNISLRAKQHLLSNLPFDF